MQDLDRNLCRHKASFEKAIAEKVRCQEDVNRTSRTIELANRLVKGLEASRLLLNAVFTISNYDIPNIC